MICKTEICSLENCQASFVPDKDSKSYYNPYTKEKHSICQECAKNYDPESLRIIMEVEN